MASNNSGMRQQFIQQGNSPYHCKECGISLNSAESLDVHLQYHKENLLKNWAIQAQSSHSGEETNNNTTKTAIKRESNSNNTVAPADSSDSMQKSRTTPETGFGHPPTPQSYQSASSPYQTQDNTAFSPNYANFQPKTERLSPVPQFHQNYSAYPEHHQFYNMEQQQYNQDSFVHKSYRCHPYSQPYERQPQPQVSSSSPPYPPQPTPSPSPKQCDKCGYVCDSASQLIEHLNLAHPPTPAPHMANYQPNQHFMFENVVVKQEDTAQSEILDLDSHKVVHNVYPEEEKHRPEGDAANPHSVSTMLNSWPHQQQKMFPEQQQPNVFMNSSEQQKMFQSHQVHNQDFIGNNVTTTTQDAHPSQGYRSFEHMSATGNVPVISSTQVPNNPAPVPTGTQKGANWKSNEARRPKTYNCTACNKWFTSSGHLKRHYNTTLHKNAVKSSGQPDPAALPISAHHHPARENNSNKQDERPQSGSSGDDIRSGEETNSMSQFERLNTIPGLLQQPPSGPYDRQPAPNIHHTPPLHSPMGHSPMANLGNGSPNGEAGLSTLNLDSRGLLSTVSTTPHPPHPPQHHGFNMAPTHHPHHMMSSGATMENNQFQMYPNEFAPHVSPAMVINSPNITGDYQMIQQIQSIVVDDGLQPLPSFAQIQAHRFGGMMTYDIANVGGEGPATAPFTYYNDTPDKGVNEDTSLTVLTSSAASSHEEFILGYSPNNNNNNNTDDSSMISLSPETDVKAHILEDIKLRLEAQPKSPEKAHTKRDYEETTGSPLISSTVITKPCLHKCYDCDKVFNKACYLTQHNKTFHSGDKPFKCSRCGKRFSCEVTYQEHLTKHAGEKPHKCELCPKQFNHKTDLRRHMCLHTGQKPYACDTCGKGFIRKDHMIKHGETHTRKTHSKSAAIRCVIPGGRV